MPWNVFKTAESGVYLGPLRLLALEVYERMTDAGILCTMLTGQECIETSSDRITASTVEMLDIEKEYDIAVIDEAQLVADDDKRTLMDEGYTWNKSKRDTCVHESCGKGCSYASYRLMW